MIKISFWRHPNGLKNLYVLASSCSKYEGPHGKKNMFYFGIFELNDVFRALWRTLFWRYFDDFCVLTYYWSKYEGIHGKKNVFFSIFDLNVVFPALWWTLFSCFFCIFQVSKLRCSIRQKKRLFLLKKTCFFKFSFIFQILVSGWVIGLFFCCFCTYWLIFYRFWLKKDDNRA